MSWQRRAIEEISAAVAGRTTRSAGRPCLSASVPYDSRETSSRRTNSVPTMPSIEAGNCGGSITDGRGRRDAPPPAAIRQSSNPGDGGHFALVLELLDEGLDPSRPFLQPIHRRGVRDAQKARRLEAFTRGEGDMSLLQQPLGELARRPDPIWREQRRNVDEQVERTV